MRRAIDETDRRRKVQKESNEDHGITPQTIRKAVRDLIAVSKDISKDEVAFSKDPESMSAGELRDIINKTEKKMKHAATELNFEVAAELRDQLIELRKYYGEATGKK